MDAALVIQHLRAPHLLAGARVQRIQRAIGGGVDDQVAVDGDVAVDQRRVDELVEVRRQLVAMLPDDFAGGRIDGLG